MLVPVETCIRQAGGDVLFDPLLQVVDVCIPLQRRRYFANIEPKLRCHDQETSLADETLLFLQIDKPRLPFPVAIYQELGYGEVRELNSIGSKCYHRFHFRKDRTR